jgi:hypothetical protein
VSERAHGRRFQALLLQRAAVTASTSAFLSERAALCSVGRSGRCIFIFTENEHALFNLSVFPARRPRNMCLCHTHGPRVIIIIIRHILRINSLSRLLLFIYLFWSAYPASHKVTHECIALVILAVARNDSNNARTDKYCAPRQIARLSRPSADEKQ